MSSEPGNIVPVHKKGDDRQLSTRESERLAACEEVIRKGLATFIEVGNALARIRDEKLYRQECKTFQKYCQERWKISHSYAHRVIEGAGVAQNLLPTGNIPTHERQVRPLTKLTPDRQREAWELATENSPDPTSREVAHAASLVEQVKPGITIEISDDEEPHGGSSRKFSPRVQEAIDRIGQLCGEDIRRAFEDGTLDRISNRDIIRWSEEPEPVMKRLVYYVIDNGWDFDKALRYDKEQAAKQEADKLLGELSPEEIKCKELRERVSRLCCAEVLEAFERRDSFEAKKAFTDKLYEVLPKLLPYGVPVSLDESTDTG